MKNIREKITLKSIFYYLQGNIRYKLFYSKLNFLIPKHIREQIQLRINSMDVCCYKQGQCKMCGCQTTMLQMADKTCDKPCYPRMLNKEEWSYLKKTNSFFDNISNKVWSILEDYNVFSEIVVEKPIEKITDVNSRVKRPRKRRRDELDK